MAGTIRAMGYSHRETMREWLRELAPSKRKVYTNHGPRIKYTPEQEKEAVIEFSVGRTSLYK